MGYIYHGQRSKDTEKILSGTKENSLRVTRCLLCELCAMDFTDEFQRHSRINLILLNLLLGSMLLYKANNFISDVYFGGGFYTFQSRR